MTAPSETRGRRARLHRHRTQEDDGAVQRAVGADAERAARLVHRIGDAERSRLTRLVGVVHLQALRLVLGLDVGLLVVAGVATLERCAASVGRLERPSSSAQMLEELVVLCSSVIVEPPIG